MREFKKVLDSVFHAVDSGFHQLVPDFFSVELGFQIRMIIGIAESLSCIPDSCYYPT